MLREGLLVLKWSRTTLDADIKLVLVTDDLALCDLAGYEVPL